MICHMNILIASKNVKTPIGNVFFSENYDISTYGQYLKYLYEFITDRQKFNYDEYNMYYMNLHGSL